MTVYVRLVTSTRPAFSIAGEHCHDAIAGVLDLGPFVVRRRLAKYREVLTARALQARTVDLGAALRRGHPGAGERPVCEQAAGGRPEPARMSRVQ